MKNLVLLLAVLALAGCQVRPGTKEEKKQESTKIEHKVPKVYMDGKGKLVVTQETYSIDQQSSGEKSEAPKLTLWEKIRGWIIGLTALKALMLALGISFPILGTLLSLWRGLSQVVRAAHDSDAVRDNNPYEVALKHRTGPITRQIINFMRARY